MPQLKGTETEKNLMTAFAGESAARNRYQFYAGKAKKEGYANLAAIFLETSNQEKEHAERLWKFLADENREVEVTLGLPRGNTSTVENLKAAIAGEDYETEHMYPEFAAIADKEGFPKIATAMRSIAVAESYHRDRYQKFLDLISDGSIFKREGKVFWRCTNCGYIHEGDMPPEECPACAHDISYFEIMRDLKTY